MVLTASTKKMWGSLALRFRKARKSKGICPCDATVGRERKFVDLKRGIVPPTKHPSNLKSPNLKHRRKAYSYAHAGRGGEKEGPSNNTRNHPILSAMGVRRREAVGWLLQKESNWGESN